MPLKRLIRNALNVLRTLPGRLLVLSASLLTVVVALQATAGLPPILEIFRKVLVLAVIVSVGWLAVSGIVRGRRQWLWAVRRKLILSYVFFGVFPVALIVVFALVSAFVLYVNTATYLFQTGYQNLVDEIALVAETAAAEIGQSPASAVEVLARKFNNRQADFPMISLAELTSRPGGKFDVITIGPWRHQPAPKTIPVWLAEKPGGFKGTVVTSVERTGDAKLVIRAAMASPDGREFVVVDLPVDADVVARLHDDTGTRIDGVTVTSAATASDNTGDAPRSRLTFLSRTVVWMDYTNWTTGKTGRASLGIDAPARQLYERMSSADTGNVSSSLRGLPLLPIMVVLGALFVIIQVSAFVGGVALARRITSAVYYLFHGTARIGQGDFTHRIPIGSNDQLGDLAGSFNNMSASIEHLRQIERDKLRLDEELQIARRIQRSLLPNTVPQIDGLCIADLCEPAMEVGGDYYDFFPLGPRQLGVLVADVSGKGTSAALYMAELKGLMLALSRAHRSPRALLVELNDLLADHLDNRSFITMTYAVVDLDAGTLTCARAGHTPLLVVSGGVSEVIVPNGMVLGLRLPEAGKRFADLLVEHTQPIRQGDVVVLYTDGITEAMNEDGDLFGDASLSRVVAAHHDLDSSGIRERILRDVRAFVGAAEPHDDMTMVVIKVKDVA